MTFGIYPANVRFPPRLPDGGRKFGLRAVIGPGRLKGGSVPKADVHKKHRNTRAANRSGIAASAMEKVRELAYPVVKLANSETKTQ